MSTDIVPAETDLDADAWRLLVSRHPVRFRVTGRSMYPTLRDGDVLEIEALAGQPAAGDAVVYLQERRLIVHRCLGNGVFRGDGRLVVDSGVGAADVVGVVHRVYRQDGVLPLGRGMPLATRCYRLQLRVRAAIGRLGNACRRRFGYGGVRKPGEEDPG